MIENSIYQMSDFIISSFFNPDFIATIVPKLTKSISPTE